MAKQQILNESLASYIRHSTEYRRWESNVRQKDKHLCQACGATANLHIHHIKPFKNILRQYRLTNMREARNCWELWDLHNGILLCIACHGSIESKKKQNTPLVKPKEPAGSDISVLSGNEESDHVLLEKLFPLPDHPYWGCLYPETCTGRYCKCLCHQPASVRSKYIFVCGEHFDKYPDAGTTAERIIGKSPHPPWRASANSEFPCQFENCGDIYR